MPRPEDLVQFADAFEAASRAAREAARATGGAGKGDRRNDRAPCPACGWPPSGHGRPHCGGAGAPRDGVAAVARGDIRCARRLRRRPRSSLTSPNSSASTVRRIVWRTTRSKTPRVWRSTQLETQRLDEQTRRYALAQAAEARAAGLLAETEQSWRELWKRHLRSSTFAGADAGMVRPHRAIHEDARQARRAPNRARGEGSRARRIEPILRALGLEAGLSEIEGLDCIRLAERFERRLEEVTRAWERSRDARDPVRRSAPASRGSESRRRRRRRALGGLASSLGCRRSPLSVSRPTRRSKPPRRRWRFGTRRPTTAKTTATGCAASRASSET